jgi:hypothetical protein
VTQRPRPTPKGTSRRVAVLLLQPLKQRNSPVKAILAGLDGLEVSGFDDVAK